MAANVWPACTSPFNPPVNAATASGNDAPKLACNAALIWAASAGRLNPPTRLAINTCPASNNPLASAGRLNPPTRLAINTCPASNNPLRPPPKLPARLAANVCPACTNPFNPPVNAATASGNDAPKLACNAALIWAANAGRLNPPARLAINTCPASNNPLRPPPKLPATFAANV
ncbi:hypothetical protein DSM43518_01525 [Mycobacterium marinum]|nr:hypothetical protein DSM43518_01525 [Mycobacterium marinum]